MNNRHKFVLVTMIVFTSIIAIAALFYAQGYRYNISYSYPTGIYKLTNEPSDYHRGELVLFCPPNNKAMQTALHRDYIKMGLCSGGFTPVIKKVMAMEGDTISFENQIVHINGQEVPSTMVLSDDSRQRPLPQLASFTLQANEFFMMSDHRPIDSFDSRYYGSVPHHNLLGHIEPVWVW